MERLRYLLVFAGLGVAVAVVMYEDQIPRMSGDWEWLLGEEGAEQQGAERGDLTPPDNIHPAAQMSDLDWRSQLAQPREIRNGRRLLQADACLADMFDMRSDLAAVERDRPQAMIEPVRLARANDWRGYIACATERVPNISTNDLVAGWQLLQAYADAMCERFSGTETEAQRARTDPATLAFYDEMVAACEA